MNYSKQELANLSEEEKRELVKKLLAEKQKKQADSSAKKAVNTASVNVNQDKSQFLSFENNIDNQQIQTQKKLLVKLGIQNPFFKVHDSVGKHQIGIEGHSYLNYSSYNYLGLSGDAEVSAAAKQAVDEWGTSVSASRIASGERPLHTALEQKLASLHGVDSSLVFVSGYATNVTVLGHLFGPKDLLIHDSLIHNSILAGCQLSGARRLSFAHNDYIQLEEILKRERNQYERVMIIVEGVYSMDGDIPEMPIIVDLKRRYQTLLMVDEAHSIGVIGATGGGVREYFSLVANDVDLWMGTLSKSFASCGGYIAGAAELIEYLKYTVPGFMYSVGISPANAAAALKAIELMQQQPARVNVLQAQSKKMLQLLKQANVNVGESKDSAVIPVIVGDSIKALQLSNDLFSKGINVQPILYPAVEESYARLRFFITADHTDDNIKFTVASLLESLTKLKIGSSHNE